jgi:uncharacterized membrane protein
VTDAGSARLDAFTDAAFAFAVTLLVVGTGGAQVNGDLLAQVVGSIPSFAIGFAILTMFWLAHVAWRRLRGPGDWRSTVLTLALVFVTLVYVIPLRGMAASLADYVRGRSGAGGADFATLFLIYGIGFTAMSLVTALLFRDALRNPQLTSGCRREVLGQLWIWTILAWTGLLSTVAALFGPTLILAPWLYATLPLSVGLFAWWYDWDGSVGHGRRAPGDPAPQPLLAPNDVEPACDDDRRA